jgi:L-ribulose-5-phosphate 3-epimerase
MPANAISCRRASYGDFEDQAYAHLKELGLRYVEIPLPPPEQVNQTLADLQAHGLTALTVHGECDPREADCAAHVRAQLPVLKALGVKLLFVSARADDTPRVTAYERLRAAGDAAAEDDVTIVIETHPDLFTNAEVALETMAAVDHPNVRINFDTANVYFYNHGVDAVSQLQQMLPHVGAVHLKDTNGQYRDWHFPALGRGIVDFPSVFRMLDDAGYTGPYTLEIEGIEGEEKTADLVKERIAASVEYLRRHGRLD